MFDPLCNSILEQCLSFTGNYGKLFDRIRRQVGAVITPERMEGVRQILVTGSGDSNIAAKSFEIIFNRLCPALPVSARAVRCIDLAREIDLEQLDRRATLFLIISSSGRSSRIREVLGRLERHGCRKLLLTNAEDAGSLCNPQELLQIGLLERIPGPGFANYHANLMTCMAAAVHIGCLAGELSAQQEEDFYADAARQMQLFAAALPEIDRQMRQLAELWRETDSFVGIGDDLEGQAAEFVCAKFAECAGLPCPVTDTENWHHINKHEWEPQKITNLIIGRAGAPDEASLLRMVETSLTAGHPTLLVTDRVKPSGLQPELCCLPAVEGTFDFVWSLVSFIPGSLLAAYLATVCGEPFFRAADSIHKTSPIRNTVGTSAVVIL